MAKTAGYSTIFCGFSSLMDIDKLIPKTVTNVCVTCFSSLMDIDKLILKFMVLLSVSSFSSLMDIDKLIP